MLWCFELSLWSFVFVFQVVATGCCYIAKVFFVHIYVFFELIICYRERVIILEGKNSGFQKTKWKPGALSARNRSYLPVLFCLRLRCSKPNPKNVPVSHGKPCLLFFPYSLTICAVLCKHEKVWTVFKWSHLGRISLSSLLTWKPFMCQLLEWSNDKLVS